MKAKNTAEIKTGKGIVFPVGTEFTLVYNKDMRTTIIECTSDKGRALIYCTNMHKYFKGFTKAPSDRTLVKQMDNGSCTTITGARSIEADGCDAKGFPAWPLALGLI